jgi:hypothetical protein
MKERAMGGKKGGGIEGVREREGDLGGGRAASPFAAATGGYFEMSLSRSVRVV